MKGDLNLSLTYDPNLTHDKFEVYVLMKWKCFKLVNCYYFIAKLLFDQTLLLILVLHWPMYLAIQLQNISLINKVRKFTTVAMARENYIYIVIKFRKTIYNAIIQFFWDEAKSSANDAII